MEFTYDLLEPTGDQNESLDRLTKIFAPLYTESWNKEKAPALGNPAMDMNVGAFAAMWFNKSMKVFIAYDDMRQPQGYLLGMVFRPLTHNVNIFQVEDWYVRGGGDGEQKLFGHVYDVLKYMGIDELQVRHSPDETYYQPFAGQWKRSGETVTDRYVRA